MKTDIKMELQVMKYITKKDLTENTDRWTGVAPRQPTYSRNV
jgi:hypothetical protein